MPTKSHTLKLSQRAAELLGSVSMTVGHVVASTFDLVP